MGASLNKQVLNHLPIDITALSKRKKGSHVLLTEKAAGVYIIAATPFTESGDIDYESADRLVEFYLSHGVSGMTILGMMGEATKLSSEESLAFTSHMLKRVNGRVPIIVGVSNAGITNIAFLSHQSMDMGAAGIMIAPPSGLGSDEKIYNYFEQCFNLSLIHISEPTRPY